MFGVHYFGQPYFGQANAGGGTITQFPIPKLLRAFTRMIVPGIRTTRALLGFNRTTRGVS